LEQESSIRPGEEAMSLKNYFGSKDRLDGEGGGVAAKLVEALPRTVPVRTAPLGRTINND
jgi:hypothetical protein